MHVTFERRFDGRHSFARASNARRRHRYHPIVTPQSQSGSLGSRIRALFRWVFRNRQTGRITVAQFPNVALWVFLATAVLRRAGVGGTVRSFAGWIGVVALAWWAVDEAVRGANPWRRFLGCGGIVAAVSGLVAMIR